MANRTARGRCRSPEFWTTAPALIAVAVLSVAACGHSSGGSSASKSGQPGGTNAVKVTMANNGGRDGCALDTTSVPAGPVTFTVANQSAPGITEGGSNTRGVELAAAGDQSVDGVAVQVWQSTVPADQGRGSPTVTLQELSSLTGGRLPVGVTVARTPGPFRAQWAPPSTVYTVLAQGDSVVSAQATSNRTAVLTGGGRA